MPKKFSFTPEEFQIYRNAKKILSGDLRDEYYGEAIKDVFNEINTEEKIQDKEFFVYNLFSDERDEDGELIENPLVKAIKLENYDVVAEMFRQIKICEEKFQSAEFSVFLNNTLFYNIFHSFVFREANINPLRKILKEVGQVDEFKEYFSKFLLKHPKNELSADVVKILEDNQIISKFEFEFLAPSDLERNAREQEQESLKKLLEKAEEARLRAEIERIEQERDKERKKQEEERHRKEAEEVERAERERIEQEREKAEREKQEEERQQKKREEQERKRNEYLEKKAREREKAAQRNEQKVAAATAGAAASAEPEVSQTSSSENLQYQEMIAKFGERFEKFLTYQLRKGEHLRELLKDEGDKEKDAKAHYHQTHGNAVSRFAEYLTGTNSQEYLSKELIFFKRPVHEEIIWQFLSFNHQPDYQFPQYSFIYGIAKDKITKKQELAVKIIGFAITLSLTGQAIPLYLKEEIQKNGGIEEIKKEITNPRLRQIISTQLKFAVNKNPTCAADFINSGASFAELETYLSKSSKSKKSSILNNIDPNLLIEHPEADQIIPLIMGIARTHNPQEAEVFSAYLINTAFMLGNRNFLDANRERFINLINSSKTIAKGDLSRPDFMFNPAKKAIGTFLVALENISFHQEKTILSFYDAIVAARQEFRFNEGAKTVGEDLLLHLKNAAKIYPSEEFFDYLLYFKSQVGALNFKRLIFADLKNDGNGIIDLTAQACAMKLEELEELYQEFFVAENDANPKPGFDIEKIMGPYRSKIKSYKDQRPNSAKILVSYLETVLTEENLKKEDLKEIIEEIESKANKNDKETIYIEAFRIIAKSNQTAFFDFAELLENKKAFTLYLKNSLASKKAASTKSEPILLQLLVHFVKKDDQENVRKLLEFVKENYKDDRFGDILGMLLKSKVQEGDVNYSVPRLVAEYMPTFFIEFYNNYLTQISPEARRDIFRSEKIGDSKKTQNSFLTDVMKSLELTKDETAFKNLMLILADMKITLEPEPQAFHEALSLAREDQNDNPNNLMKARFGKREELIKIIDNARRTSKESPARTSLTGLAKLVHEKASFAAFGAYFAKADEERKLEPQFLEGVDYRLLLENNDSATIISLITSAIETKSLYEKDKETAWQNTLTNFKNNLDAAQTAKASEQETPPSETSSQNAQPLTPKAKQNKK